MAIAAINRDILLTFRIDKECGKGHIEESDTCHIGNPQQRRQTKSAKRKAEVAKASADLEKLSVMQLVKADLDEMAAKLDIDDSQVEKAVDDLIDKRSVLLVEHAGRAFKGPQMAAKVREFAKDEFENIYLSPNDALDEGWPIRSMANALESPEKLNLWMRKQVSGWLESDGIYENTGLPDEVFGMADEGALFRTLRSSVKEVVNDLDAAQLHSELSKFKPLADKLPAFRREANKALDKAWDDARAKYPFEIKTVQGRFGSTRVADNEANRKKVSEISNKETEKWEERWVKEIENAGLKPVNLDSLHTDALYGVRFEDRNTSIVVEAEDSDKAIAKARKKKKRGGDKAVETWQLNETQARQARAGTWVRTNSKGESRAKQGYRGVGPKPKAYRGDAGQRCGKWFISSLLNCTIGKGASKRAEQPQREQSGGEEDIALAPRKETVYYGGKLTKKEKEEEAAKFEARRKRDQERLNQVLADMGISTDGDRVDARKVASSSGKIPGKRCKDAYISASYNCSSHRGPDGKLTAEGKASARELAAKVRARRGLKSKTAGSRQDIETQITNLEADLKKDNIPAPVKVAARKELTRLRSQLKDGRPNLKVIEGGQQDRSLEDLFKEADRIGSKYQDPKDPASLTARRNANAIVNQATGSAMRKASGVADLPSRLRQRENQRRNVTQEFDNRIADIRKIKDPQERYNAAQALQTEARRNSSEYSRDAFQGIRRKVSNLVKSTRQSAARKEGTQPTRARAPYALPTRQAPTRVRAPDGRLLSIDSMDSLLRIRPPPFNLDARKRKCLKPEDKDTRGRRCGKRARGFIGPQLPPRSRAKSESKSKSKKLSTKSTVKQGRKSSSKPAKKTPELSNISHDYALSVSPRITKERIDEAWGAIESEGARERVNRIRGIIDKHDEKVFFTPENVRNSFWANELLEEGELSPFEKQIELFKQFEWNRNFDGLEPEDVMDFISPSDSQSGFTLLGKEYRYAVVKIPEKDTPFKVDKKLLNNIADSALNPPKGRIWWSNSQIARYRGDEDTAAFVTYLHETGHRIRTIAEKGGSKIEFESHTKYGQSNSDEWFAEHFTLWTLDAEAYRRKDPGGAREIEETIKLAEGKI